MHVNKINIPSSLRIVTGASPGLSVTKGSEVERDSRAVRFSSLSTNISSMILIWIVCCCIVLVEAGKVITMSRMAMKSLSLPKPLPSVAITRETTRTD